MSKRFLLFLFLLIALTAFAQSNDDQWHKNFPLTGKPDLRFNTGDTNIHIEPWDQNSIDVQLITQNWKIGTHGLAIHEHQTGNLVELEVPTNDHGVHFNIGWERSRRVDITVRMPREAKLDIHTQDGNIDIHNMKGDFLLKSGDGHQRLDDLDGNLDSTSGDGRIELSGRFDVLHLHSGDGRIEARVKSGSKMERDWSLHAGDGSITLRLPKDFSADVSMHTRDGHINVNLPITVQGKLGGNDIRGKLNAGGQLLSIHTGDGSIHLEND